MEAELQAAMDAVARDVYTVTAHGPREAKMRTVLAFLACWKLPFIPYTSEVVYALGAALKRRGYRSAEEYLTAKWPSAREDILTPRHAELLEM